MAGLRHIALDTVDFFNISGLLHYAYRCLFLLIGNHGRIPGAGDMNEFINDINNIRRSPEGVSRSPMGPLSLRKYSSSTIFKFLRGDSVSRTKIAS